MADSLDVLSEPAFFNRDLQEIILPRLMILPLGQASCPFWLLTQHKRLACLIRTREKDREHGEPSYNMLLIPLSDEVFQDLRERVERDRIGLVSGVEDRGRGMNFLAFQYGDWLHVLPQGIRLGSTEVNESLHAAIEQRLATQPGIAAQERLTGDSRLGARWIREWIAANDWMVRIDLEDDDVIEVDITPWADRVDWLAKEIIQQTPPTVEAMSRGSLSLLQFVFGDIEAAARMASDGFGSLANHDPWALSEVIRVLDASARRPLEDPLMEALNHTVATHIAPLFERSTHGWDVVRPAEYREKEKPS
jgi:hypothetical protein